MRISTANSVMIVTNLSNMKFVIVNQDDETQFWSGATKQFQSVVTGIYNRYGNRGIAARIANTLVDRGYRVAVTDLETAKTNAWG
jgi:hypothetical protein